MNLRLNFSDVTSSKIVLLTQWLMINEVNKIMLSLCLIKANAMTYGGVKLKLHAFLILRDEWSTSRPGRFPWGNNPWYPMARRRHSRSGCCGEKKNLPPPPPVAIPTELFRLDC
jgi:hypothetical protein